MTLHRLYLLRHAKSSWADSTLADVDRPLNLRGRQACELVAAAIHDMDLRPDLVLTSPARRCLETLAAIRPGWPSLMAIQEDPRIYEAEAQDLLALLAEVAAQAGSVLLLGHNPGLEDLAMLLGEGKGGTALSELKQKYPTGALALLEAEREAWRSFAPGGFKVVRFLKPRDLDRAVG